MFDCKYTDKNVKVKQIIVNKLILIDFQSLKIKVQIY